MQYRAPVLHSGRRGRPSFIIEKEQLLYLRSASFSWSSISTLLGVSRMTLYRRRVECGMLAEPSNTKTDDELTEVLQDLKREMPYIGEVVVLGALRSMGISVTRSQCRRCIRIVDPINSALRWQGSLHRRRPYSVPGPNSLWHIGNYTW